LERILSKEEIAELLSAVKSGSLDSELEVEDYGEEPAAHVSGFSLVQTKTQSGVRLANFDILLDAFARNLTFAFSSRLQRAVVVERENIGSVEYETLISECSNNQVYGITSLDPLKKSGLLIFDPEVAFAQVEIMLGGGNVEQDPLIPARRMTTIELNILRETIAECCQEMNKAFAAVEQLDAQLQRVEVNPRLVTIVPADTEMMVAVFKVKIDQSSGKLRLAIPLSSLDPIREKLKSELGATSSGSQWASALAAEVMQMEVEVVAQLASVSLNVREILDLRVGDVIDLDCRLDSEMTLLVEGQPKFTGLAGLRDGEKALKVLGRISQRR